MEHNKKSALLFLLTCIFGTSFAATLFEDNFGDSVASKANWIFPAAVKRQFTNGTLSVQNIDTTYMWFVTHNFSAKASTFTLSATITLSSQNVNDAGLGFCMSGNDGITLWVGSAQNMYAYKGSVLLFNTINSFINTTTNTVKISKKDSVFYVFCNGTYVNNFICSDTKYMSGGDVALAVPAKTSFQVDDIMMTDQFETGKPITAFIDTFTSGNTHGWYLSGLNGTASVSSGSFTIANTGVTPADPYISGNFNQASLRVIATHKQGAGYYGLAFFDLAPGPLGDTVKSYLFLVDSARDYASGLPDSPAIYAVQTSLVHGDKDTLEVLRFSNKYKFRINGAFMPDSFPLLAPGRIDVAGLYVGGKTTVSFEDFVVGDSTWVGIIPQKQQRTMVGSNIKFFSKDIAVFNLQGRMIKRGTANYLSTMRSLSGGMYIMRSVENKTVVPEKSFTNVK